MVLEYVAGRSLARLLDVLNRNKRRLPLEHTLWIARCVLMALHRAHTLRDSRGQHLRVVHRDISPENVLLGYDGRVKLIDFGIAISRINTRDTRVGMVKGKLEYMSPEQAMGAEVDARTDIYSFGLVLYEMLTGVTPLAGDPSTALARARQPSFAPVHHHDATLPRKLDEIVNRALSRRPDTRYETAKEMMLDCVEVLHELYPRYAGEELAGFNHKALAADMASDSLAVRREGTVVLDESGGEAQAIYRTEPELFISKAELGLDNDTRQAPPLVRHGKGRRSPPPIPREAVELAQRIDDGGQRVESTVRYPRDEDGDTPGDRAFHRSDTVVDGGGEGQPDLAELLAAIEDIYDRRSGRIKPLDDEDEAADSQETRVFRRGSNT